MDLTKVPECKACNIKKHCIFSNLESRYLGEISKNKDFNFYKKGSIIFHENNYPQGVYGIYEGKVKVYKTSEVGKEHILRLAKTGDVLGYRSVITGEKHGVSARVLEDCRVCFIPKNLFIESLKNSINLTHKVIEILSLDLKNAESKIIDLVQKSVKERVAASILLLKNFYGMEKDKKTINTTLSRGDLSDLVGTATESLIRSLAEFKKNKILALNGKKIMILNVKLLEKIANLMDEI